MQWPIEARTTRPPDAMRTPSKVRELEAEDRAQGPPGSRPRAALREAPRIAASGNAAYKPGAMSIVSPAVVPCRPRARVHAGQGRDCSAEAAQYRRGKA